MFLGPNGAAKVAATLGLILLAATGCTGSDDRPQGPDADATGMFSDAYGEAGFIDPPGHLLQATAARAKTTSYVIRIDEDQAFAIVGNCTSGRISVAGATSPCTGKPHGLVGLCSGQHMGEVTVQVSEEQPRDWGLAVYRTHAC